MARGVNTHFVSLVLADKATLRNWSFLALGVGIALHVPAYLFTKWQGVSIMAASLVIGTLLGIALGTLMWKKRQTGLQSDWNGWMKAAEGRDSIRAVHRATKGHHERNLPFVYAMLGATYFCGEATLVLLALSEKGAYLQTLPFLLVNGLLTGMVLGHCLRGFIWTKALSVSLEEMVQDGEIGVWGVH